MKHLKASKFWVLERKLGNVRDLPSPDDLSTERYDPG